MRDKLFKYLPGPLFILSGVLWLVNGYLWSGICFIIAGVIFCFFSYDDYKKQKNKKEEA